MLDGISMISMNSSLSDRASANQAFLDALEQLGETFGDALADEQMLPPDSDDARSEERRVGKECRSRWAPYH